MTTDERKTLTDRLRNLTRAPLDRCAVFAARLGIHPDWITAFALLLVALAALFAARRRKLSLVDCTSFELMRRHGLSEALALDDDFARQGYRCLPAP